MTLSKAQQIILQAIKVDELKGDGSTTAVKQNYAYCIRNIHNDKVGADFISWFKAMKLKG